MALDIRKGFLDKKALESLAFRQKSMLEERKRRLRYQKDREIKQLEKQLDHKRSELQRMNVKKRQVQMTTAHMRHNFRDKNINTDKLDEQIVQHEKRIAELQRQIRGERSVIDKMKSLLRSRKREQTGEQNSIISGRDHFETIESQAKALTFDIADLEKKIQSQKALLRKI